MTYGEDIWNETFTNNVFYRSFIKNELNSSLINFQFMMTASVNPGSHRVVVESNLTINTD